MLLPDAKVAETEMWNNLHDRRWRCKKVHDYEVLCNVIKKPESEYPHQSILFNPKFKAGFKVMQFWKLNNSASFRVCVFQQICQPYLNASPQSVRRLHWGCYILLMHLCNFTTEASLVSQHTSTGDEVKRRKDLAPVLVFCLYRRITKHQSWSILLSVLDCEQNDAWSR